MTEISRPWDGNSVGDAGPYSGDDWALIWNYMVGMGAGRPNNGPFLGTGTSPNHGLIVQAQNPVAAAVNVLLGSAICGGKFYLSDATKALTIAANASGNPRIDTVILRADYTLQTVVSAVLQGTPAASPTPPTLTQTLGVTYEIPLADVAVANGFVSIAQGDITPRSEWANAALGNYEIVLNNSGGTLEDGDVVIWDSSANQAVTTTTTQDNRRVAGILRGRVSNGGYGLMQISGIGYVKTNGATTRGNLLATSGTAKQAVQITSGIRGAVVGRALETTSGTGLVLTEIHVRPLLALPYVRLLDSKANTTGADTYNSGAWRTHVLTTEESDTENLCSLAANQFTLQPGVWFAWASIQGNNTATTHRIRIYDTTGAAVLIQGNNSRSSAVADEPVLVVWGPFSLTVASALELQYWNNSSGTGGAAVSTGETEIYAEVFLVHIGEIA